MKKLIITYKNGRHRKEMTVDIEDSVALDPVARGQKISAVSAALMGPVVNWRIED